jgi:phospholipid/cholesterol/gamma-HCH transport system permease protein
MREWADFSLKDDGRAGAPDGVTLALSGPLRVYSIGDLDRRIEAEKADFKHIDLSGVSDMDTSGAWLVWRWAQDRHARIEGADDNARKMFEVLERSKIEDAPTREPTPALTQALAKVGDRVIGGGEDAVSIVGFFGALVVSLFGMVRHPARIRGKALVSQMQLMGVNSLSIIGLMSFLIGIVIAQQGAAQLEQFGAQIYTINLTGRLATRELGILMTSIMIAGRSGSAFAAQIGTMRLTEEIDAMRTIGVEPMEALIVPRVLASVLMMPLLGFYAALVAILGGATISAFTLDIPFITFLQRIRDVVLIHDVWVGLIKGPVFGFIIGLTGCYQGLQVEGNAEEVGLRTTQAVVTAIFTVIVLDAFFAVFFSKVGWGGTMPSTPTRPSPHPRMTPISRRSWSGAFARVSASR